MVHPVVVREVIGPALRLLRQVMAPGERRRALALALGVVIGEQPHGKSVWRRDRHGHWRLRRFGAGGSSDGESAGQACAE